MNETKEKKWKQGSNILKGGGEHEQELNSLKGRESMFLAKRLGGFFFLIPVSFSLFPKNYKIIFLDECSFRNADR